MYKYIHKCEMIQVGASWPHTSCWLCVVSLPRFADLDGQPNIARLLMIGNYATNAAGFLRGSCGVFLWQTRLPGTV